MQSVWFVGTGRAGAAHADGVAARLRKAEADERSCEDVLGDYDRAHRELEERVERLEAELAEARRQKLEAFARWWNCREDRDRARHVARRLRRRLKRMHRREAARGRAGAPVDDAPAVDVPAQAGGAERAERPAEWPGQVVRWAYLGPDRGLPLGGNGHPAGRRTRGSGPIPSQREGGEDAGETGGSGGVGGDRERQRPRVGWKRANGTRRRPRD